MVPILCLGEIMGLFSSIKKAFKKVFKGIKKVFKKVGKFIGKIAGSKWGKILLTAAAIFTGGMALMAGWGAFTGTTGTFMTKFVAGAKGFMAGLANPIKAAKGAVGAAQSGTSLAQGAAQGAGALPGAAAATPLQSPVPGGGGAEQLVPQGGQGVLPSSPVPGAEQAGKLMVPAEAGGGAASTAATVADTASKAPGFWDKGVPGMLKGAGESLVGKEGFLRTPGGAYMASNMLQGYSQGKMMEDQLKHGSYADRQWADPRQVALFREAYEGIASGSGGYLDRQRKYANGVSLRTDGKYQRGGSRGYATGVTTGG